VLPGVIAMVALKSRHTVSDVKTLVKLLIGALNGPQTLYPNAVQNQPVVKF